MRKRKKIKVGRINMGGNSPVVLKGMIKSPLSDTRKLNNEIKSLNKEGCEVLRVAVENEAAADVIPKVKAKFNSVLEADIHFDYRLALLSMDKGVDIIRLNPLNIYRRKQVKEIISKAKELGIPIRVGVNSGGVIERISEKKLVGKLFNKLSSYVKLIESQKFDKIVLSAKTHSVYSTLMLNRRLYEEFSFPLNIGVTATGPYSEGVIKSSIALGSLLSEGIGDGIRVSLNSDSAEEVRVAKAILQSVGVRNFFPNIISCPTCSRCKVDLKEKVEKFKETLHKKSDGIYNKNITIALMGCPVNGPGEASMADVGIAFGDKYGMLFKNGEKIKRTKSSDYIERLMDYLKEG